MTTVNPDQQTVQQTSESGANLDRLWWLRETESGEIPADPEWNLYSDLILDFNFAPDPGTEAVHGTGAVDPEHFSKTTEESEVTVRYALQKPVVDADGSLNDALADALLRNEAYQIPNTHAMVARDTNPTPGPDDPDGCAGQRMYTVMRGGKADLTLEPDAEAAEPTPVELAYTPEKARSFHIWQPDGSTTLTAYSTSDNDSDQTLTVESEGAGTTEELSLNGTTEVTGAESFSDIDAAELSASCDGDVVIENDAGSELTRIRGGNFYADSEVADLEADLGVPSLGAGSAPSAIGTSFEDFAGDRVERPAGVAVAPDLRNISLEVDNDLEPGARHNSTRARVGEGNREITISAEVVGENTSHNMIESALAAEGLDMEWEMSRTLFTFPEATVTDPPERERGPDDVVVTIEGTYQSKGVEVSNVE